MYSSRGSGSYGQQPSYVAQTGYAQNMGSAYPGNSVGGPDSQQHSMASRHSSMLGASQEADTLYRSHPLSTTHYGGQYSSVYSSAALSSKPQGPPLSAKGSSVASALEGRGGYASTVPDSPKYLSSDYISSSNHGYGHRTDQLFTEKVTEYPTLDRRQYSEHQSAYLGRDLKTDAAGRFSESSVGFRHQRHADSYDRVDQMSLLRQEQLLKAQSLQSDALDGSSRQNDYLAAKAAASRHSTQELFSYGVRVDADPRNVSVLNSSYGGQNSASILGAAPRRNMDELIYSQSSSNPGYGVSLPPGRDYAAGKGLHGTSIESDYSGSMLTHKSNPRIDEHKDDSADYLREFKLREEDHRRERFRMREKERDREKARERERDSERERERERERRERERDRERERERERERILERQKERDREFKRGPEIRRERAPRVSKDIRGSSLTKEGRPLRRDSPHFEDLHRHHSPVKEKRREYVCKVYAHSLIDVQRDYLSLEKRYPRLFVSPEFSKVIVNWPKEQLNLSIHTPVSFEHDFIEEGTVSVSKVLSDELKAKEPEKSDHVKIVWNVKIILMSGISKNALEELSSERSLDDRIPHFCNILRFAILKKDRSFMAIGGPWQSSDGGDPSVDADALVQTALRYAKDVTQLDLQNCLHWNRFLEIHYDRYGKDGVFSHKEVSVLLVPDLSDCLPSLNVWKEQWLAHKKTVAERERHIALKMEISKKAKEGMEVKEMDNKEKSDKGDKFEKEQHSVSTRQADIDRKEKSDKGDKRNTSEGRGNGSSTKLESKDADERGKEAENVEKADQREVAGDTQKGGTVKSGKKKIVRKIVKQKAKTVGDVASKKNVKLDEKADGEKNSDIPSDQPSSDSAAVKTFGRNQPQNEKSKDILPEVEDETDCSEDKSKDNSDLNATVVHDTVLKTTVKKKVIKRVPKKKVRAVVSSEEVSKKGEDGDGNEKKVTTDETHDLEKSTTDDKQEKVIPKSKSTSPTTLKACDSASLKKAEKENVKNDNETCKEISPVTNSIDKQKVGEKDNSNGKREKCRVGEQSKDEKEKLGKDESRSKPNKELKEKRKSEEPHRHPGLILQTKCSKDSKFRSLSLSLDSLLEYTDKDIEESTFELSLFAESLYEMLQYQMGSRILTFLQKLRIKFVAKRNQRKRQREDIYKEDKKKSSPKRPKTTGIPVENQSIEPETLSVSQAGAGMEGKDSAGLVDEIKMEMETDYGEDPEEDPEEDEELDDTSSQHNSTNENETDATVETNDEKDATMGTNEEDAKTELNEEAKTAANVEPENVAANQPDEAKASNQKTLSKKTTESDKRGAEAEELKKKEVSAPKEAVVDKELLQAFRFFDRNLVGYIRVEDMRMMIHNMGNFLSHRDVKELVHSALLESNTGRDDRILYGKLVRMSDI